MTYTGPRPAGRQTSRQALPALSAPSGGSTVDAQARAGVIALQALAASSGQVVAAPFTPADLFTSSNDGFWVDLTDAGAMSASADRTDETDVMPEATVGFVADKSGNGNHFSAVTGAGAPIYNAKDKDPGLYFDGATTLLEADSAAAAITGDDQAFTLYLVLTPEALGTQVALGWGKSDTSNISQWFGFSSGAINHTKNPGGANNSVSAGFTAFAAGEKLVLVFQHTGTASDFWVWEQRTKAAATHNTAAMDLDRVTLGALVKNGARTSGSSWFNGVIGEAILVNEAHDDATVADTVNYLLRKHHGAPEAYDLCGVAGQSNGAGQAPTEDARVTLNRNGLFRRNNGTFELLKEPTIGTANAGFLPQFANEYRARTGRGLVFFNDAVGGSALLNAAATGASADWSPDGDLAAEYDTNFAAMRTFLAASTTITPGIEGTVWAQGEAEGQAINGTTITGPLYQSGLEAFAAARIANLGLDFFGVIQTGSHRDKLNDENWAQIRLAQRLAVASHPKMIMLFDGAKTFPEEGRMFDDLHWNGLGMDEVGKGAAQALAEAVFTISA